ncbi:MAG: hypothetical protein M1838_002471 [Thelocarpon superellum]|nr:MAG: hypothetical protein M1838_002471 [Thelocarpon superellum]
MESSSEPRNIVIIGGGIIGCCTAYYLTRHPAYDPTLHHITVLEASKIAGGSSGRAGGLLALWAYPSCLVPLSYGLHAELAQEHGGEERWGYRRLHCGQLVAKARPRARNLTKGYAGGGASVSLQKRDKETLSTRQAAGLPADLDWVVAKSVEEYEAMGDPDTTAQVHPFQFTTSMAALATEKGAHIHLGSVTDIVVENGAVRSVAYRDQQTSKLHTIPASTVVLSAGPWTQRIWPAAPISALRAHSVTIRPSRPVSAYALFTEIEEPGSKRGTRATPEIYARPQDEVYACGEGDVEVPLPASTDLVQVDERRCQKIIDQVSSISDELGNGEVLVRQACYLPNVEGAVRGPLVGETGVAGLLMAAGHTCWGIQNGPGTGKLMSEFVFDGRAKSADIASLDPRAAL